MVFSDLSRFENVKWKLRRELIDLLGGLEESLEDFEYYMENDRLTFLG